MINGFVTLSLSHQNVSIDELSDFIPPYEGESLYLWLDELKDKTGFDGLLYLATCNRMLFIVYDESPFGKCQRENIMRNAFAHLDGDKAEELAQLLEVRHGISAIEHIIRVAASMESLVIGEREILRQLREAYDRCKEHGLVDDNIRILIRTTVEASKSIYTRTRIGNKPVSVVSLAARKLKSFQFPPSSEILMIGAGESNRLMANFLDKMGYNNIHVLNRTKENAEEIAARFDGTAGALEDRYNMDFSPDIVISCTASPEPLVTDEVVDSWPEMKSRMLMLDLAVPQDISVSEEKYPHIQYFCIEDLREIADRNMQFRESELQKATEIAHQYAMKFYYVFQQRQVERALATLPQQMEEIQSRALDSVFKDRIENLDSPTQELIKDIVEYMKTKSINIPMKTARTSIIPQNKDN